MLITRDDIQRIGNEETLLHFLEEKLNLPIPEDATLAQIALPLPLPFLGLDDSISEQVIDCWDFKKFFRDGLGERRPFLIRFRHEQNYPRILRRVAEGLSKKNINPSKITFICANRYFRPFAFAYFNDAEPGSWHAAVLEILAWTQDNTYIQTSYVHKLPVGSFAEFRGEDNAVDENVLPEAPDSVDTPQDTETSLETFTTVQPVNRDKQQTPTEGDNLLVDENVLPEAPDSVDTPQDTETSLETFTAAQPVSRDKQQTPTEGDNLLATPRGSESQQAVSPPRPIPDEKITNRSIIPASSDALLDKLQNIGEPLGHHWNIHAGITPGRVKAFVIDESERESLIREDANSRMVITPIVRTRHKKKWEPKVAYLIWISNSLHKQWPWSDIGDELEAEQIFVQTYPAISQHLIDYRDILKSRSTKGKYYWELYLREFKRENFPEFYRSKIVYPLNGNAMRAAYDTSEGCILNSSYCIPTDDLSLLAILNSKLFGWYARDKFKSFTETSNLFFTKKNMEKYPIAFRSENQKMEFSFIVGRILNNPDSPDVPDIEREIDQLVYELYELTPAEIALIEEESNP